MNKLSIIIPVYNVEKYLVRCLDSVINQTYKNLEIIIINDASQDSSQQIIDTYKNKDERIISIVNEENIYQGESRNKGLRIASGEYITFVDSDDWIEKEMYEEMMGLILKIQADIVECNFKATNSINGSMYIKSLIPLFKKNTCSIDKYIIHLSKNELGVVVWNKIYRTEILKVNKVKFEDNKEIFGEDLLFNLAIMHYANSIITINKPLYNYYIRDESVSHRNDFISLNKIISTIKIYVENTEKFESFRNDLYMFSILIFPFIKTYILNQTRTDKTTSSIKILRENKLILMSLKNFLKNPESTIKDKIFSLLLILKMNNLLLMIIKINSKIRKII